MAQKRENQDFAHRTAISQVLNFCLLALQSKSGSQSWVQEALNSLNTWVVDIEAVINEIPRSVRLSLPHSEYHASSYEIPEFTMKLRSRGKCGPDMISSNDRDKDSSSSSDQESRPNTPTPTQPRNHPNTSTRLSNRNIQRQESYPTNTNTSQQGTQRLSFCNQSCLLGLVNKTKLDIFCPNVSKHRGGKLQSTHHQIDHQTFLDLLQQQLELNLDHGCYPLGMEGSRGALFQITLIPYGYTVVAKGTVAAFVKDLQYEYQVYQYLSDIQGTFIPVCLGSFNLVYPYYYDIGVQIVHMMFLAWGGRCLEKIKFVKSIDGKGLDAMMLHSLEMLHGMGVLHSDLRLANMLWNEEKERIMLIDFERSKILPVDSQTPLTQTSPNQKRRQHLSKEKALSKRGQNVLMDERFCVEGMIARQMD
ncbi:hypothetical protein SBOR_3516 [Sclerotinia borealis F-4128]|uniref:Protein kinase domain-containing protein n=1 Tax=Sclerotinia borealis (strain F-4128) TaxID=1432307 RepID=W9CH98_SCLBF|nr:hypothetical protein SBOR_3516 [Sclerotinia borealis F-4128]